MCPSNGQCYYFYDVWRRFAIEWNDVLDEVSGTPGGLALAVFSKPRSENGGTVRIKPVLLKGVTAFQATRQSGSKQFHENIPANLLREKLAAFSSDYAQAELFTATRSYLYMRSKKGRETVLSRPPKPEHQPAPKDHDREKSYILPRDKKIDFLVYLGLMNDSGMVYADKQRKFAQINRFLEMVDDVSDKLPHKDGAPLRIIDFGCGKAYLTFAMYHYFTEIRNQPVEIVGLDLKEDVIAACRSYAEALGMNRLSFQAGDIGHYAESGDFDMMVSLHACDTATDAALEKAIRWNVPVVLSAPCCQHELNRQIENSLLEPVMRHGLLRERFAALLTDAIRAQILALMGYSVSVLEFVDDSHTPKNLMIRAVKTNNIPTRAQIESYKSLVREMNAKNWLHRALKDKFEPLGII